MTETADPPLVEALRGEFVERVHRGAFAVCAPSGEVVEEAGDVTRRILPRSAIKLFQALPLVESGAADERRLGPRRLALACASHRGEPGHVDQVGAWLSEIGLDHGHLMCGAHPPTEPGARKALRAAGGRPSQLHNNCSGKHAGFLTLALKLGAPTEGYIAVDHPVQKAAQEAFAEATGEETPLGWATDGCSAPNFAASLRALARAAAKVARPEQGFGAGVRARAAERLRDAMATHPFEVSGTGGSTLALIEAAEGRAVVKSGAEGSFLIYLVEKGLGAAVKVADGDDAAAACAAAALLVRHGAVDPADPRVKPWLSPELVNLRGVRVGEVRPAGPLAL